MTNEMRDQRDDDLTPAQQAEDLFVHGLLESYYLDTAEAQEARVARVISALNAPGLRIVGEEPARSAGVPNAVNPPARAGGSTRVRRFFWRLAPLAAAAGLALAVIVPAMVPPSATAMVRSSLDAARAGGDRRYEVRARLPGSDALTAEPIATVDVRGVDRMAIRLCTPRGETLWTGRDAAGAWAIKPDGTVDRLPPRQVRPRWLDMGESTMLVESVASLLEELERGYDLTRAGAERLPGETGGATFDRITARRRAERGPEPVRIELWLETSTHLVQRMELHWPEHFFGPAGRAGEGKGFGGGPGRPEGPDRPRPDGEGERPRGPGMPGDRPPPPDGRMAPGGGPRMGPPPERPEGPMQPRHPSDGPPGEGPRARPGPGRGGPEGLRGGGGREFGPPRFIEGPPEFGPPPGGAGGPGRHAPPPRVIVFQRVAAPQFDERWFSPEAHGTAP